MTKRRSDLFREYARVIDMCEGTKVDPEQCVKINSKAEFYDSPAFNADPNKYTFAIAIVEDKPVFAGDVLYNKQGYVVAVHGVDENIAITGENRCGRWPISGFSWTKPDEFAHILQAQAEGKRVVFYDGAKWIDTDGIDTVNFKPESYKVVESDHNETYSVWVPMINKHVETKYTKDGITGKITAEVIE